MTVFLHSIMKSIAWLFLSTIPSFLASSFQQSSPQPTFEASSNSTHADPVRVMLLPHTHDDPGWTATIQEYYNGGYEYKHYGVRAIYNSLTKELEADHNRKFIVVEIAFFSMWWEDTNTTDLQHDHWRSFFARGQVEFATGGWVMQDEIASHFAADINQMTLGHRWIVDNLGSDYLPTTAWHIDEQGHVSSTVTMVGLMQFEQYVVNRIPQDVKEQLQNAKGLEFIWQGLPASTPGRNDTAVFTRVLDTYGYCPPNTPRNLYFWDDYAYWDPLGGDPEMTNNNTSNIRHFVGFMAPYVHQRAQWVKHNVVLFPWGCDFEFQNATAMFTNMDAIMAFVNNHADDLGFTLEYATLKNYFDVVKALQLDFGPPVKRTDFFPYALPPMQPPLYAQHGNITAEPNKSFKSQHQMNSKMNKRTVPEQNWWSGEFTSYPLMKKMTRKGAAKLRAYEQLLSQASMIMLRQRKKQQESISTNIKSQSSANIMLEDLEFDLNLVARLRQASAEAQHHDAVDGTSPARVTRMWEDHLSHGSVSASKAAANAMAHIFAHHETNIVVDLTNQNGQLQLSADPQTLFRALDVGNATRVIIYNSLPFNTTRVASFCIPTPFVQVRSLKLNRQANDYEVLVADVLNNTGDWPTDHWPLPGMPTTGICPFELLFTVPLPALGYATVVILPVTNSTDVSSRLVPVVPITQGSKVSMTITNDEVKVTFTESGTLQHIQHVYDDENHFTVGINLSSHLWSYPSNTTGPLGSNNYKFLPEDFAKVLPSDAYENAWIIHGRVVQEFRQRVNKAAIQRFRVIKGLGTQIFVSHAIGPLLQDTEVCVRYKWHESTVAADKDHERMPTLTKSLENQVFFSDESGLFMQRRTFEYTKQMNPLLNIAANYVPYYSTAFIRQYENNSRSDQSEIVVGKDDPLQITLLTQHSHGLVGGNDNATLEVMLHRQPPDDNSTVTSHFILLVDTLQESAKLRRPASLQLQNPVVPFFSIYTDEGLPPQDNTHNELPILLPPQLDLLNLDVWNITNNHSLVILIRLQHLFEANEHTTLSAYVSLDVKQFVNYVICGKDTEVSPSICNVSSIEHRSLNAVTRVKADEGAATGCNVHKAGVVTIQPLAICTFLVNVSQL